MKHEDLKIVHREFDGQPVGIRDRTGFLLHVNPVFKYEGQQERYERELIERQDMVAHLLEALRARE